MSIPNTLLILVLIIIIVIVIYSFFFKITNIVLDDMIIIPTSVGNYRELSTDIDTGSSLNTSSIIPYTKASILKKATYNMMFSMWFYISSFSEGSSLENPLKNSLAIIGSNSASTGSIDVTLKIYMSTSNNSLNIDVKGTSSTLESYKIDNFPLQKWNCLTVSSNNEVFDVYLDGKLINSYILNGQYQGNANSTIYLGSSTSNHGYITRVRYQTQGISPEEAYSIYKDGINSQSLTSFLNKYKLQIKFYETNKVSDPIFNIKL